MTYKEAQKLRSNFGKTIHYKGMTMKVVIAPKREDDFIRFVDDYRIMRYTDKSAVSYSSDQQFRVCALWTDGASVIHKQNLLSLLDSTEEEE